MHKYLLYKFYFKMLIFPEHTNSPIFSSSDVMPIWKPQNNSLPVLVFTSRSSSTWSLFLQLCTPVPPFQIPLCLPFPLPPWWEVTVLDKSDWKATLLVILSPILSQKCKLRQKCDVTYLEIWYVFKHKWVGNGNLQIKRKKKTKKLIMQLIKLI